MSIENTQPENTDEERAATLPEAQEPAAAALTEAADAKTSGGFRRYTLVLIAFWSAALGASFLVNYHTAYNNAVNGATIQARTAYEKDVVYRRWNSNSVVYAKISDYVPPNEYLGKKQRDLDTGFGFNLTKVNPAYMTRLVHELGELGTGTTGHITSTEPIRPANMADAWEGKALTMMAADSSMKEYSELQMINGVPYLRFMGSLITEQGCIGCHPTYTLGSLRGGIGIGVPMQPFYEATKQNVLFLGLSHGILWLLGVIAIIVAARSMSRPISMLVSAAGEIARGRYDALPPSSSFKGEMARLWASLDSMTKNIAENIDTANSKTIEANEQTRLAHEALHAAEEARKQTEEARRHGMLQAADRIKDIVRSTRETSERLIGFIEQAVEGAGAQSLHAAETADAMEAMNKAVAEVAQSSASTAKSAESSRDMADTGASKAFEVKEAIAVVDDKNVRLKEAIGGLSEQAQGISSVMNVITDIADQTNLLALNAAIEAARAGDAGRGFSVVADEVRKLAEKTMLATKEVADAVQAIQSGTQASISGADESTRAVGQSSELALEAETTLREIVALSQDTAAAIEAIATASEEQSASCEEFARGTAEVKRIAEETSAIMQEAEKAVSTLDSLTKQLEQITEEMRNA